MNGTKQVVRKELARVFGDKKLIFSLFILPALLLVVIYSLMGNMANNMINDVKEHVPIIYIQNAPEDFKAFLLKSSFKGDMVYFNGDSAVVEEDGQSVARSVDNLKKGVLNGDVDLILSFEEDFSSKAVNYESTGEIPEIRTFYNPTEDYSQEARSNMLTEVLEGYKQKLLAQKMGDLNSITMFYVDKDPEAAIIMDEEKAGSKMMSMMFPYLIVMLLFTGPMSLGVDSITGEKERGTMASMLITPIKRSQIVMGKLISLSVLSCLSAVVYAVSMTFVLPNFFNNMGGGETGAAGASGVSFGAVQIIELVVIMLTLVFLYVNIVSLFSVFAKTVKEANAYISPVYIVVIIAGVLTMFAGNSRTPIAMFGIPLYGSAVAIQKIMTNELTMAQFGITAVSTLVVALLITALITKAFNSEKVMFNA